MQVTLSGKKRRDQGNPYSKFAEYYDSIYNQIVNYERQTNFLERIFERFHHGKVRSILDIGCGTGNFTVQFAKRGYAAIGIDLADEMIRIAKRKRATLGTKAKDLNFFQMDMRDIRFDRKVKFEIATVLFGGFGYLTGYSDASKFFRSVRNYLSKNGLLIFEFWHVGGVRPEASSEAGYVTWQKVEERDRVIIRLDASKYDPETNRCQVLFDFYVVNRRTRELIDSFTETHYLKLYSMSEIQNLLEMCGFKVIGFFKDSLGSSDEIEKAEQLSFRILALASPR